MSAIIRLSHRRWPSILIMSLGLLLLAACNDVHVTLEPAPVPAPCSDRKDVLACKDLTFTSGQTERGRQPLDLGTVSQPGRYTLRLESANPPQSGHWLEWDYLALKANGRSLWQIGDSETPPDYSARAADEFCPASSSANCPTAFEVTAGKIDPAAFPATLNDGSVPSVYIDFVIAPEQTGADLVLTLSTLYATHTNPNVDGYHMQVTLRGPHS